MKVGNLILFLVIDNINCQLLSTLFSFYYYRIDIDFDLKKVCYVLVAYLNLKDTLV